MHGEPAGLPHGSAPLEALGQTDVEKAGGPRIEPICSESGRLDDVANGGGQEFGERLRAAVMARDHQGDARASSPFHSQWTDLSVLTLDMRQTCLYTVPVRAAKASGTVRERLLRAADELFYREGVYTVGIDRILAHAGVAKASLYGTFGSKEELVRAYLEERASWLQKRIEQRVQQATNSRERILAAFDEFAERAASDGVYYGCPFIRSCAEGTVSPSAARDVAAEHRMWRLKLFTDLAREAELPDAELLGQQLSLIYDGATVAVAMDEDSTAATSARKVAERLLAIDGGHDERPPSPRLANRRTPRRRSS